MFKTLAEKTNIPGTVFTLANPRCLLSYRRMCDTLMVEKSKQDGTPSDTGTKISKSSKRRHKKKQVWTENDKTAFETGYTQFGNNWKLISQLLPSKSPRQIHSYAKRTVLKYKEAKKEGLSLSCTFVSKLEATACNLGACNEKKSYN
eukprot:TRINITY_DN14750_c0_g1_i1.p1 TRINITY_DN14750_c0_g1~~TRINITY_DN14750_c0_g1_i1.p1  ORF type:complete len:147 (+),score=16.75 TRINITY_DN14750_c0_g1_i1:214-654(+)